MASSCMVSLLLVLGLTANVYCIKDGAEVNGCDYPGLAAVVSPSNTVSCTGIISGNNLLLPEMCGVGMNFVLSFLELNLFYGDGTSSIALPIGTTGTEADGVYTFPLPSAITDACDVNATLYDSATMNLNLTSCEMVGYGTDTNEASTYDAKPDATPITYSTSQPCCDNIIDSVDTKSVVDTTVPLNCLKATGSACGSGDLGSPIYCKDQNSDQLVVVGMTATAPCISSELYLAHDLTSSDDTFKF